MDDKTFSNNLNSQTDNNNENKIDSEKNELECKNDTENKENCIDTVNEKETSVKSKLNTAKRIYKIVVYAMSLILMISAPVMLFLVILERNSNQTPVIFGYSMHIVVTGSMEPEIMIGDLVIAKKTDINEIEVGDDIVFTTDDPSLNGINIVHRVVKVNGDGSFQTQGVAKGLEEDKYPATKIIGRVVVVSSAVGKIFTALNNNRNYVFAVLLAILMIMIISEIIKIIKIQNEKKLELINAEKNKEIIEITKDEEFIKFKQELYAKMLKENSLDNIINQINNNENSIEDNKNAHEEFNANSEQNNTTNINKDDE